MATAQLNFKNKMIKLLRKFSWRVQEHILDFISTNINTYGVKPYGCCPVQAEGKLPTGEYYYFRSRHESWSLRIGETKETMWNNYSWVYTESKYDEFEGGGIGKLEVVRNFKKAVKLYYRDREILDKIQKTLKTP